MSEENLEKEADGLFDSFKEKLGTLGHVLKLPEAWRIIQDATAQTVIIIERNVGRALSGPEKKAKALARIEKVIDVVCALIDVPFIPDWAESYADRYIKLFLLEVADGSIDALVKTFHDTGVFPPKEGK